jgi:hypothetical protein
MSPIQLNSSVSIEPLEFAVLLDALQALAVWAHSLSAKINSAIQMVVRAMPVATYSLSSTKELFAFEIALLPLTPQALVHVLTWSAPLDIEEETWARLLMDSRARISWTLADKIRTALSNTGKRHQSGILLSLLALCTPTQGKYPSYRITGAKTKGIDPVETVIQIMEQTFGVNNHVQATSLQLYYTHIRNTPMSPLPATSIWSDDNLLRALPSSTITIQDTPTPFPFPIWEADATHPTARLKWAPPLDSVGSPYTVGLLCQTLCTSSEILLLAPPSTTRAGRTALPTRMPSHAEFITPFRLDLTRSLTDTRKAALKDLANTLYGPDLFSPFPPLSDPRTPA